MGWSYDVSELYLLLLRVTMTITCQLSEAPFTPFIHSILYLPLALLLIIQLFCLCVQLPQFQADVEEIVDRAQKEEKMEQMLNKIEETWKTIVFLFSPHKGSELQLVNLQEEDFETLEDQQVTSCVCVWLCFFLLVCSVVGFCHLIV